MSDAREKRMLTLQQKTQPINFKQFDKLSNYIEEYKSKKYGKSYNFARDCFSFNDDGDKIQSQPIERINKVIEEDRELKEFFSKQAPNQLNGCQYEAVKEDGHCIEIGRGDNAIILLATSTATDQYVSVKIMTCKDKDMNLLNTLREFMFTSKAYHVLGSSSPKPIGLLIQKPQTRSNLPYMMLLEFCGIIRGLDVSINLDEALGLMRDSNSVLLKQDCRDIALSLIDAVDKLQRNRIAHVDLRPANVIIQFDFKVRVFL